MNIIERSIQILSESIYDMDVRYHLSLKKLHKGKFAAFQPEKLKTNRYSQYDGSAHSKTGKPNGFWYAFGDSWLDLQKVMGGSTKGFVYSIDYGRAKIYEINSESDLDFLVEEFPYEYDMVDWDKFAKKYDGVEIRRVNERWIKKYNWSSVWDVPSGCIINISSLKIKLEKEIK
jgi:hypothetical protein